MQVTVPAAATTIEVSRSLPPKLTRARANHPQSRLDIHHMCIISTPSVCRRVLFLPSFKMKHCPIRGWFVLTLPKYEKSVVFSTRPFSSSPKIPHSHFVKAMTVAIPSDDAAVDVYATVSSLYGPGTVSCWYLTTLSVLTSWTLHPHKRKSNSIDIDLIATLTFPVVAAGHLISQARLLLSQQHALDHTEPPHSVAAAAAAIEAPFVIVEIFMQISVILFLIAAWRRAFRRLMVTGVVGLLCFAVECYIQFSTFQSLDLRHHREARPHVTFQRYFVADFTTITIAITVLLAVVSLSSTAVAVVYASLARRNRQHEQPRPSRNESRSGDRAASQATSATATHEIETARVEALDHAPKSRAIEHQTRLMTYMSTLVLPVSFLLSLLPTAMLGSNAAMLGSNVLRTWLRTTFFPRTSLYIRDLDQAVAVAAGATILAFNLYSVMKAHYKMLSAEDASSLESVGVQPHISGRGGDARHR